MTKTTAKLTEIKSAARNTYGYQGGHGRALTVTAHCSKCSKRVTCQQGWVKNGTNNEHRTRVYHEANNHTAEMVVSSKALWNKATGKLSKEN